MGQLLDSAIEFLNEDGWQFNRSEANNWVSLNFTGENGSWLSWFQDRGSVLVAYASCPVKAPTNRLKAVSEFVARANFDLGVGNFEMSFDTGAIRYKSGVHVRDEHLSKAMAASLFYITNATMDDYFPGIMAVIYGDTAPDVAIARVEEAIELRRKPSSDGAASVETPATDSVAKAAEPISDDLAALLARLSSGLGEPESEQGGTAQTLTTSEREVRPPDEL
jgi:hypothetical protein